MHDPADVNVGQRAEDLAEAPAHLPVSDRAFRERFEVSSNVPTLEVLHRDEGDIALDPRVDHADDVGMTQTGERTKLSLETQQPIRLFRRVRQKDFERNVVLGSWIDRLVDDAHSPCANSFDELVAPYLRGAGHDEAEAWAKCGVATSPKALT